MQALMTKVKDTATGWGEELEPPASESEIKDFSDRLQKFYNTNLPDQYESFLRMANGLEFNGLIIYGTKNSESAPEFSQLDFFKMNEIWQGSPRARELSVIILGESSSGVLTYDKSANQFQYRDRIGLDRVEPYPSFNEMLRVEIEKVL